MGVLMSCCFYISRVPDSECFAQSINVPPNDKSSLHNAVLHTKFPINSTSNLFPAVVAATQSIVEWFKRVSLARQSIDCEKLTAEFNSVSPSAFAQVIFVFSSTTTTDLLDHCSIQANAAVGVSETTGAKRNLDCHLLQSLLP
jgi:hypothetical protein